MDEGQNYRRLGLFVLVTLALVAGILFVLGGRSLFQPTFTFETYFNESVAGLEIGAPVNFRGVPLGQVTEIVTASALYQRDVPLVKRTSYIVVRAKVSGSSAAQTAQMEKDAQKNVELGLRVQTQLAGITGQQYLALDYFDPKTHPPLEFDWTPKYPYVPSGSSLTGTIIAKAITIKANDQTRPVPAHPPMHFRRPRRSMGSCIFVSGLMALAGGDAGPAGFIPGSAFALDHRLAFLVQRRALERADPWLDSRRQRRPRRRRDAVVIAAEGIGEPNGEPRVFALADTQIDQRPRRRA